MHNAVCFAAAFNILCVALEQDAPSAEKCSTATRVTFSGLVVMYFWNTVCCSGALALVLLWPFDACPRNISLTKDWVLGAEMSNTLAICSFRRALFILYTLVLIALSSLLCFFQSELSFFL